MARINLSIPDTLKERMDKHSSINWSQAATGFFEEKLNSIESTIEVKDMTDAIARLKASKANFKDTLKKDGYEYGISWAMKDAEYEELKRLAEAAESNYPPEDLRTLAQVITELEYDFDELMTNGIDEPEFVEGFIEGAVEVFEKVEEA